MLFHCTKDETPEVSFNPTDFIIRDMGKDMRLSISGPFTSKYIFSGNESMLNFIGDDYICTLVPETEMEELANNLSDTIIFQWEVTTSEFPYPENECKFRVTRSGYGDFMCSIGKGDSAVRILQGLSTSITGDTKETFDEIVNHISN
jgi:hypothetical protein